MKLSLSRSGFRKTLHYSTTATVSFPAKSGDSLYRRISPLGSPTVSIVPVLDQWVAEGRSIKKEQLQNIIKELRHYNRFKHALEQLLADQFSTFYVTQGWEVLPTRFFISQGKQNTKPL